jgi:hypothetical protein
LRPAGTCQKADDDGSFSESRDCCGDGYVSAYAVGTHHLTMYTYGTMPARLPHQGPVPHHVEAADATSAASTRARFIARTKATCLMGPPPLGACSARPPRPSARRAGAWRPGRRGRAGWRVLGRGRASRAWTTGVGAGFVRSLSRGRPLRRRWRGGPRGRGSRSRGAPRMCAGPGAGAGGRSGSPGAPPRGRPRGAGSRGGGQPTPSVQPGVGRGDRTRAPVPRGGCRGQVDPAPETGRRRLRATRPGRWAVGEAFMRGGTRRPTPAGGRRAACDRDAGGPPRRPRG